MKKLILILLFVCASLSTLSKERALLVGIGTYPNGSGWQKISSVNDVVLLKDVMPKDYIVTTLVDDAATHKGIIQAIEGLIAESSPGDIVLIHFSCHGQQVVAINKTDEPDHLDEALVPYDALQKKSASYHGECHLLDDEIGELMTRLRLKVGENGLVVVTIDACFSDSMYKGKAKPCTPQRGGAGIFGADSLSAASLTMIDKKRKTLDSVSVTVIKGASDILFLSACKSYQRNFEIIEDGKGYGPLSYSMYIGFRQKTLGIKDVGDWLSCVLSQMGQIAFTQTPQVRTTLHITPPQSPTSSPTQSYCDTQVIYLAAFFVLAIILLIIVLLIWKKKPRKNRR